MSPGENLPAMPGRSSVAAWPEAERRDPAISDRHFLALRPLVEQLSEGIATELGGRSDLAVLDIGCGNKPYLPLFEGVASTYFGVDAVDGPAVDAVGVAEALPCEDQSFDVVLCTQVLEHVDDPAQCLSEIRRVLKPGGVVFLSTHGVFLYHPDPPTSDRDYWRWTHSGLLRIFRQAAEWESLGIQGQGNVVACLGYITAQFVDELGQRLPGPLARGLLALVNTLSWKLDKVFPPNARVPAPGSLSANYLVTARAASS